MMTGLGSPLVTKPGGAPLLCLCLALGVLAGCPASPKSKPPAQQTPDMSRATAGQTGRKADPAQAQRKDGGASDKDTNAAAAVIMGAAQEENPDPVQQVIPLPSPPSEDRSPPPDDPSATPN